MAVYKCKSCGAALNVREGESVVTCEYCDVQQSIPKVQDSELLELYERARELRFNKEFDRAEQAYEKIIEKDRTQAEAYWGIVLSRYGIEYVKDPDSKKNIPTCHRASFEAVTADMDFRAAVLYADALQREIYERDAETIDNIRKEILRISEKEEPYDVFICYKQKIGESFTADSHLASQIYHHLKNKGYRVFFAEVTLIDKAGTQYEPYIFAALNSAKVMLVLGTNPEYVNSVWVKNEWSRFLRIMRKDSSRMLLACYKGMNPKEFPAEFNNLQALNMGEIGFITDLMSNIEKYVKKEKETPKVVPVPAAPSSNVAPLLKRAEMYLEDGDFDSADEYCEKVLDQEPENARAYLYKLLVDLNLTSVRKLADIKGTVSIQAKGGRVKVKSYDTGKKIHLIKEIRGITGWGLAEANNYVNSLDPKISFNISKEKVEALRSAGAEIEYLDIKNSESATLESIENNNNYKKFLRFASEGEKDEVYKYLNKAKEANISETRLQRYTEATSDMRRAYKSYEFSAAASKFEALGDYMEARKLASDCREKEKAAKIEEKYQAAVSNLSSGDPERLKNSFNELDSISNYKDSASLRDSIPQLIEKAEADILEKTRNRDFEYAIGLSSKNRIDELRRSINILKNLGDYKNSKAMVTVLTTKLNNLENKKQDEELRAKYKGEYEKLYPDAAKKDEYASKCKSLTNSITSLKAKRRESNPGCFSWGFLVLGLIFAFVGVAAIMADEEDLMGAIVFAIIMLIFSIKSIVSKLKDSSSYSSSIKYDEKNLAYYQQKIIEASKQPTFDDFIAEKKKLLSAEEKKEKAEESINIPDSEIDESVKCRMCGSINIVKKSDLSAKCNHCGYRLKS